MADCATISPLVVVIAALLLVYLLTELHYFGRTLVCYLHSQFIKKRLHVLDTAHYTSVCLTTDVDFLLLHMNNARYLREVDFARTDFYNRTRLWSAIRERGGRVYQGATSVRYRRLIRLFARYRIESRVVYWDGGSVFMEHRFVTPSDGFVRAVVYGRQRVVGCDVDEVIGELTKAPAAKEKAAPPPRHKPQCPRDLELWIESMNESSRRLRQNATV